MSIKERLIEVLMDKLNQHPEDWGLAEFISEIEGNCYTEAAMAKFLETELEKEKRKRYAQLLAAAPEMYDVVEEIASYLDCKCTAMDDYGACIRDKARQALRKARGEE